MASFNKVIIAGNLTRDPEMRVTPQGTPICQFGLAINRNYTSAGGEKREEVTFVDCEAWTKTAELIAKYLKKGSSALLEGRLKLDTWEDAATKQKRSKLKVVIDTVQFLGGGERSGGGNSEPQNQGASNPPPARGNPKPAAPSNLDEDVPF